MTVCDAHEQLAEDVNETKKDIKQILQRLTSLEVRIYFIVTAIMLLIKFGPDIARAAVKL